MDFTGIYELRDRLKVSIIAGAGLIDEDFRLKKAIDAIRPLTSAAPVFAKLIEQCDKLYTTGSGERSGALADAMVLTDAVICTLQSILVKDEIEDMQGLDINHEYEIFDLPYSEVKELVIALTESGSGHYETVKNYKDNRPWIFNDYRILPAYAKGLEAPYSETADLVYQMMRADTDNLFLPFLKKDFNPAGGKAMEKRLRLIIDKEGALANDFYIKILPEAVKDIRLLVIDALHYSAENVDLLMTLYASEKGKAKKMALHSLSYFDTQEVRKLFDKISQKKSSELIECMSVEANEMCSHYAAEIFMKDFSILMNKLDEWKTPDNMDDSQYIENVIKDIAQLKGKIGNEVFECIKCIKSMANRLIPFIEKIDYRNIINNYLYNNTVFFVTYLDFSWFSNLNMVALPQLLQTSLIVSNEDEIREYGLKIYNEQNNIKFLPFAMLCKLTDGSFTAKWLCEERDRLIALGNDENDIYGSINNIFSCLTKNNTNNQYTVFCEIYDLLVPNDLSRSTVYKYKECRLYREIQEKCASEVLHFYIDNMFDNKYICLSNMLELCDAGQKDVYDKLMNHAISVVVKDDRDIGYMECKEFIKRNKVDITGLGLRYVLEHKKGFNEWRFYEFIRTVFEKTDDKVREFEEILKYYKETKEKYMDELNQINENPDTAMKKLQISSKELEVNKFVLSSQIKGCEDMISKISSLYDTVLKS